MARSVPAFLQAGPKRGDRPEFEVVTGVSAGAIIAPFAFLGPSEDEKLHTIWTQYKQDEVVTTADLLRRSLADQRSPSTAPLAKSDRAIRRSRHSSTESPPNTTRPHPDGADDQPRRAASRRLEHG